MTLCITRAFPKLGDLLDLATAMEIITKRGSFFNYGELRLGQGRENAKDYLRAHNELAAEIEMAVRERAASGETALGFGGVVEREHHRS